MTRSTQSVLVIAAHPDDEILGCGGAVAIHARDGSAVTSLVVCEGESLRYGENGAGQDDAMRAAARILGVGEVRNLRFPDQQLDRYTLTDIITPLEKCVREVRPDVVYVQWGGDVNRDHRILFEAALVATRPTESCIRSVLAFDTASSTEWGYPRNFVPDTWIDIGPTLEAKLAAMSCYASELRDYPHPRSIEALRNKARAWGNQVCLDAAEVFMTVRCIHRHGPARA